MTTKSGWPSFGTVDAGASRFLIIAMMLLSPLAVALMLILTPYLVPIRAAWSKKPRRFWRGFVIVSCAAAIVGVVTGSPIFLPHGMPFTLPAPSADTTIMSLHRPFLICVNALLVAGLPLLPLALFSTLDTLRMCNASSQS